MSEHDLNGIRVAVLENVHSIRETHIKWFTEAGADVVAEAASQEEFDASFPSARPDVAVIDIHLARRMSTPNIDGLKLVSRLKSQNERVGVLVITGWDEASYMLKLMEISTTGIGYLLKENAPRARVVSAVAAVHAGENVLDQTVFAEVVKLQALLHPAKALTEPEAQVLRHMAEHGLKTGAIAGLMHTHVSVIERHLSSIYKKFDIDTGPDAKENSRVTAVLRYVRDLQRYYSMREIFPRGDPGNSGNPGPGSDHR